MGSGGKSALADAQDSSSGCGQNSSSSNFCLDNETLLNYVCEWRRKGPAYLSACKGPADRIFKGQCQDRKGVKTFIGLNGNT
jgi:hypothetical protein